MQEVGWEAFFIKLQISTPIGSGDDAHHTVKTRVLYLVLR